MRLRNPDWYWQTVIAAIDWMACTLDGADAAHTIVTRLAAARAAHNAAIGW